MPRSEIRPLTPIMNTALEALQAENRPKVSERKRQGVWLRYPDRRRRGRGYAKFHVSHVTMVALAKRQLVRNWPGVRTESFWCITESGRQHGEVAQ